MIRQRLDVALQTLWYGNTRLYRVLLPLSGLYCAVMAARRYAYRSGLLKAEQLPARVIVVGNLTVGGTGKTPLVIALARRLQQAGYRVGILSRGYGGRAGHWPQRVAPDSDPGAVGDEAPLLARHTGAAVFAGPDRVAAARALLAAEPAEVLISDDGLQHLALRRDLEIALVDAGRGLGNGHCLPAGPLREPRSRLSGVDAVAALGDSSLAQWAFELRAGDAHRLTAPEETASLATFANQKVHAVAGIGNPQRFFALLREAGLDIQERVFPDHHRFRARDLAFDDQQPVLMTEKDALKCRGFASPRCWYVPVSVRTPPAFDAWLLDRLA